MLNANWRRMADDHGVCNNAWRKKKISCRIALLLIILPLLSGCDCIFIKHVEIDTDGLPAGTVGIFYYAEVNSSIHDEPFPSYDTDDLNVSLSSGNLPPGLTFEQRYHKGIIRGTPTATGTFSIRIGAHLRTKYFDTTITYQNAPGHGCYINDSADKDFTLRIN